ncbi:MAG TPA: VCBS repeat-containing protein, partial [Planctomycetota bacterium]|nr:VCBS repeat-containing protein [Planctomycetota bacterium]
MRLPSLAFQTSSLLILIVGLAAPGRAQDLVFRETGNVFPEFVTGALGAGDADGDGDADLFGIRRVLLNEGGRFIAGPTYPALPNAAHIDDATVGDFDGDGRADLAVVLTGGAGSGGFNLAIYLAPPPGGASFVAVPTASAFLAVPLGVPYAKLVAFDADQDGATDLLAHAAPVGQPASLSLLLNVGAPLFFPAPYHLWPPAASVGNWFGVGDFDGDGFTDVAHVKNDGALWWRRSLGYGPFDVDLPATGLSGSVIVAGDFDGDGFDDLAAPSGTLRGGPSGPTQLTTASLTPTVAPIVAADVDADGYMDALVPDALNLPLSLHLHRGSPGGLLPATSLGSWPSANIVPIDANGDGDLDLPRFGESVPTLAVHGVGGAFSIVPQNIPEVFRRSQRGPPYDVDQDGDVDFLVVGPGPQSWQRGLYVARNDGNGRFVRDAAPLVVYAAPDDDGEATWLDLDGDGDSDLLFRALTPGILTHVFRNDGGGAFAFVTHLPWTHADWTVAAADFDGDADVDVMIGRAPGVVAPFQPLLYRSVPTPGGWTYLPGEAVGVPLMATDLDAFDLENDGDVDVLVSTLGFPRMLVNDGTGAFAEGQIFGVATLSCAVADLDDDGVLEIITGGTTWKRAPGAVYATH